jgi:hypothetical protein
VGFLSESRFSRHGKTTHDLSQEIELGLPYRFEIGFENHAGLAGSRAAESRASVEARYAFAKWGALPLNPAISGAYIFGVGDRFEHRPQIEGLRTEIKQPNAAAADLKFAIRG